MQFHQYHFGRDEKIKLDLFAMTLTSKFTFLPLIPFFTYTAVLTYFVVVFKLTNKRFNNCEKCGTVIIHYQKTGRKPRVYNMVVLHDEQFLNIIVQRHSHV